MTVSPNTIINPNATYKTIAEEEEEWTEYKTRSAIKKEDDNQC